MSKIVWDAAGKRLFETGLDRGVLFPMKSTGAYDVGVPWNGLISVNEASTGAEPNEHCADNMAYATILTVEKFKATIEAFGHPTEFGACDGSAEITNGLTIGQQPRKKFGLVYRTKLSNDIEGYNYGYKLHLIYGCMVAPSERNRKSTNETPEPMTMSWEVSSIPVKIKGFKPLSHLVVESTKVEVSDLAALESVLYGGETTTPRLPLPDEVVRILSGGVTKLSAPRIEIVQV